ncbi:MAG TPA: putative LPS assembly protein LptD, partial [Bacteroidales bacterium]|nr:putative LPS assembly protein LptD [Bacteroidales bacterium]
MPRHYLSVKTPGFAPQRLKWGIISLFIVLLLFPEISIKATKKESSSFYRKTISLFASPDTLIPQKTKDSLIVADTNLAKRPITDSLLKKNDTLASSDTLKKAKKPPLEAPVLFTAKDSIRFNIKNKQIYMFQDAKVKYQEITLDGNYIESDFSKKLVTSTGLPDSTGKLQGNPIFTEKQSKFKAKQITYNFDSKKGLIKNVITEQGEGFLHGEVVKKFEDNTVNILHGKYTTCNLDHPHFEFQFNRSKVIPDNKIVTGPAWLVIEDIPTPLFLPFGIFPNKRGQRSGIIIPTFGEST